MDKDNPIIQSPCTKLCKIDVDLGVCTGCYRTLNEITEWSTMPDEEKIHLLKKLEDREPGIRKT